MKDIILVLSFLISTTNFSQSIDTMNVNFRGNDLYHIKKDTNSRVLIFLHGGVSNPLFDDTSKVFELDLLLEGNKYLIPLVLENGYDLLIPVTNDSMNWLTNHKYCYENLLDYIDSSKIYDSKFISGFSDGGTGSFKIFYNYPDSFQGLTVFNGYPQHENFYQEVNYEQINNKMIAFFSTFEDKIIPYEFLLTEYCKQKKTNANTFFYVKEGRHSFDEYMKEEINLFIQIMTSKINNTQNEPIHAYMKGDEVQEFYPFRKKICKRYCYGKKYYLINKEQAKQYNNK